MKNITLTTVENELSKDYYYLFENFGHFENLLRYVLAYTNPVIMVDDLEKPTYALLKFGPAVFVKGDPNKIDPTTIFDEFSKNSWIVPSTTDWDIPIMEHFVDQYEKHNRVLFDSSSLDLEHILQLKKELPVGMKIIPISQTHIEDKTGMIYQDLITKFFSNHDFLKSGKGFVLIDDDLVIGYAATDNPIIGNDIELMFRVGYDDFTKYRGKGYGVLLCVYFIEYCIKNNLIPSWDAHNDVSAHIARKLGYTIKKNWTMFHIL